MKNSNYEFRFAKREDTSLVLKFIKAIASYEEMPDAVKYTEESLENWLFDRKRGEAFFVMEENKEVV